MSWEDFSGKNQDEENTGELPEILSSKEKEFPAEVIEKIMGKVIDIKRGNDAYHIFFNDRSVWKSSFRKKGDFEGKNVDETNNDRFREVLNLELKERLESVLGNGILSKTSPELDHGTRVGRDEWVDMRRKGESQGPVYFNIIGRSFGENINEGYIEFPIEWVRGPSLGVLFDHSNLHEIHLGNSKVKNSFWKNPSGIIDDLSKRPFEEILKDEKVIKQFEPGDPRVLGTPEFKRLLAEGLVTEKGYFTVNSDWGFETEEDRISPRVFEGIIFLAEQGRWKKYFPNLKEVIVEVMKRFALDNPDRGLPLYSEEGDLLWPKEIKYDDLKKMVEDRGKNKSGE